MDDVLSDYLGVVPFDVAQAREYNLYAWARKKLVYDLGLADNPGAAPLYFLNGIPITAADRELNRERAEKAWQRTVSEGETL